MAKPLKALEREKAEMEMHARSRRREHSYLMTRDNKQVGHYELQFRLVIVFVEQIYPYTQKNIGIK